MKIESYRILAQVCYEYFIFQYRIFVRLSSDDFSLSLLAALPGIIDVHAEVVDTFAFLHTDKERQEETDEFLFGY